MQQRKLLLTRFILILFLSWGGTEFTFSDDSDHHHDEPIPHEDDPEVKDIHSINQCLEGKKGRGACFTRSLF